MLVSELYFPTKQASSQPSIVAVVHSERHALGRWPPLPAARLGLLRASQQQHQRRQQQRAHLSTGDAEHRQQQRYSVHRQRE